MPGTVALWALTTLTLTFLGDWGVIGAVFASLLPAGLLLLVAGVVGSVKGARRS